MSTEELEQLLEAKEWAPAHKLLVEELAPTWIFSSSEERRHLQAALDQLQQHQAEIDLEASGRFRVGAGLYCAYLLLQVC